MLTAVLLNIAYDAFRLNVIMPKVVMLNVVVLRVAAPIKRFLTAIAVKLDRLALKTISTYASKARNKYLTSLCPALVTIIRLWQKTH